MFLFYIIALIPCIIGIILWMRNRQIVFWEWLVGTGIALLTAFVFNYFVVRGMTQDIETWSGQVEVAWHIPQWHASWWETVSHSDGKRTWTTIEHREETHYPKWFVDTSLGRFSIDPGKYSELVAKMGQEVSQVGYRPDYDYGDRNDYHTENPKGWLEPITDTHTWSNKVMACPSVFSYEKVNDMIVPVFGYPENTLFQSGRLLGRANSINLLLFDQMNARLGPSKKVNIIMIGFVDQDSELGQKQEAEFIGGKKNDLVLCYNWNTSQNKVSWAHVFGWTEKDIVKRNLETLLLTHPVDNSILPLIETEVFKNYEIKNWTKFDYLQVEVPWKYYVIFFFVILITQFGYYLWAFSNDIDKEEGTQFRHYVGNRMGFRTGNHRTSKGSGSGYFYEG